MNGLVQKEHVHQAMLSVNLDYDHLTSWSDEDLLSFSSKLREISLPIFIAANKIDKRTSSVNLEKLSQQYPNEVIPCSALTEFALIKFRERGVIDYNSGESSFQIIDSTKINPKELQILNDIQDKILKQ